MPSSSGWGRHTKCWAMQSSGGLPGTFFYYVGTCVWCCHGAVGCATGGRQAPRRAGSPCPTLPCQRRASAACVLCTAVPLCAGSGTMPTAPRGWMSTMWMAPSSLLPCLAQTASPTWSVLQLGAQPGAGMPQQQPQLCRQ